MTVDLRWIGRRLFAAAVLFAAAETLAHVHYGADSHAYWVAARHLGRLYGTAPGTPDAYLYSPAFAQVLWPFASLPWLVFEWLWTGVLLAVYAWLVWPLRWWAVPALAVCSIEAVQGNVYALLGAAAVLGVSRWAGAWAFAALTKITPAVGLVWFAARREWRQLAVAVAVTAAVAAVSVAVDPGAWVAWGRFLLHHQGANGSSMWPARFAAGIAVTVYAARSGRAWLLAPAMYLTQPMMAHVFVGATMLAAIPRLHALQTAKAAPPPAEARDEADVMTVQACAMQG